MTTNQQLVPIYTDWANRHLAKVGHKKISDLSTELRDYRLVAKIIQASVSFDITSFNNSLSTVTTNLEGLDVCLVYLKQSGINCSKVTATDLDKGQLSSVLQFLFALSQHKQQEKIKRKEGIMAPNTTRLPSLNSPSPSMVAAPIGALGASKLAPPSRIGIPKPSTSSPLKSSIPSGLQKSGIRAPGNSQIRPPSGNNNGSVISSGRSTASSSATYTSIPSATVTPPKPANLIQQKSIPKPTSANNSPLKKSQIQAPKSAKNVLLNRSPSSSTGSIASTGSKASTSGLSINKTGLQPPAGNMLKLKLFGATKEKKDKTPQGSPATVKKTVTSLVAPSPVKTTSLLKPKESKITRIAVPNQTQIKQTVQFRPKPDQQLIAPPNIHTGDNKRSSKSSEEDSAYAGFGSTSPASSTQSSISLRSNSSKGSREGMCDSGADTSCSSLPRRSSEDKPTLAVRALPSETNLKDKVECDQTPSTSSDEKKSTIHTSPTVGVVSPMLQQRKVIVVDGPSLKEEKCKPPIPIRTSRLEHVQAAPSSPEIPSMSPIRQPPTYSQLMNEGRIHTGRGHFDSSTSEDSLDSVTTTIRQNKQPVGYSSAGNTMDKNRKQKDNCGYNSEGGLAAYEKMQERLRECRENIRRGHFDYGDSFEDSSSLSSGLSENFEDVSTDELSGPDMAAIYAKATDYQNFKRTNPTNRDARDTRGSRSSSTSLETRARRMAEQENLHQLLQQCRTSQRGAATMKLRSPGYATVGHLALNKSGDDSLLSRTSERQSDRHNVQSGFHSLDRKAHLAEMREERLAVWDARAAMALVSPRRIPNTVGNSSARSELSQPGYSPNIYGMESPNLHRRESAMSRSMVVLETSSACSSPARRRRTSPRSSSHRAQSPRSPRVRMPLSVASPIHNNTNSPLSARSKAEAIYGSYRDPIQLHKLSDDNGRSPSRCSRDPMGSQLSLASSTVYASLNEKYESELRKMNRKLENYRHTVDELTRKNEDCTSIMEVFDQRLVHLGRHVEKAQLKPEELSKLRQEIEHLRKMSTHVTHNADGRKGSDGAGELLTRQPSLESVASMASHKSSMSSSSKSSKTDKMSLNSFGKKKSWIRSSFTKAFTRKKNKSNGASDTEGSPMHLASISGSSSKLDEIEVVELKKQLEDRECTLTDVRLDALDRAREVDVLRETVNRLKYENKQLKQDMTRLLSTRSRASSHQSLSMNDEDHVYEMPPTTSSSSGGSSKRSSGCNSVKVTVNVDMRGVISSVICPDNEIIIGFLGNPTAETTWGELDQQIYALFDVYIGRIDPERLLGLHCQDSVIGYQIGSTVRHKNEVETPETQPKEVIGPTTTIRMFLNGAAQESVDSVVLECLFPRTMLDQLLKFLLTQRRLVLSGATGIGKSNLARQLAAYLAVRIGLQQDSVQDIRIPDDTGDKANVKVERQLESVLRGPANTVVLLDNVPRHRMAFVSSVFSSAELGLQDGPFVICTVNRACQLPEMQVHHNFKMFLLTNRMDGVKGFMGRFLRRRIIEAEFRVGKQTDPELIRVIQFLPRALQAVNTFIEKTNSLDVTVGPRIFLQCPLGVAESRDWFVQMWNVNIVPYMVKVAREGMKVLGRCGSFEDPTDVICEHWPWNDGSSGEQMLIRLPIEEIDAHNNVKQPFNPLDTLMRIRSNNASS